MYTNHLKGKILNKKPLPSRVRVKCPDNVNCDIAPPSRVITGCSRYPGSRINLLAAPSHPSLSGTIQTGSKLQPPVQLTQKDFFKTSWTGKLTKNGTRNISGNGIMLLSSPVTVAGPQWIFTTFPETATHNSKINIMIKISDWKQILAFKDQLYSKPYYNLDLIIISLPKYIKIF